MVRTDRDRLHAVAGDSAEGGTGAIKVLARAHKTLKRIASRRTMVSGSRLSV